MDSHVEMWPRLPPRLYIRARVTAHFCWLESPGGCPVGKPRWEAQEGPSRRLQSHPGGARIPLRRATPSGAAGPGTALRSPEWLCGKGRGKGGERREERGERRKDPGQVVALNSSLGP